MENRKYNSPPESSGSPVGITILFKKSVGDKYADIPHFVRLADQGIVYENACVTTPVCAPGRFTLITDSFASRMGTESMHRTYQIDRLRFYSHYLQQAIAMLV